MGGKSRKSGGVSKKLVEALMKKGRSRKPTKDTKEKGEVGGFKIDTTVSEKRAE